MAGTSWASDAQGAAEIRVHVQPGARRSGIAGVHGDSVKVAVREKATEGRANRAVCVLLAEVLGVPASRVDVAAGNRSRRKRIRVEGITAEEAVAVISGLLRG